MKGNNARCQECDTITVYEYELGIGDVFVCNGCGRRHTVNALMIPRGKYGLEVIRTNGSAVFDPDE